jgi:hypothetical protein
MRSGADPTAALALVDRLIASLTRYLSDRQITAPPVIVDARDALHAAAAAWTPVAQRHGIALRVRPPRAGAPLLIRADPTAVRRILDNLIDNAVRATPPGGRIELAASVAGAMALLTVSAPVADAPHVAAVAAAASPGSAGNAGIAPAAHTAGSAAAPPRANSLSIPPACGCVRQTPQERRSAPIPTGLHPPRVRGRRRHTLHRAALRCSGTAGRAAGAGAVRTLGQCKQRARHWGSADSAPGTGAVQAGYGEKGGRSAPPSFLHSSLSKDAPTDRTDAAPGACRRSGARREAGNIGGSAHEQSKPGSGSPASALAPALLYQFIRW